MQQVALIIWTVQLNCNGILFNILVLTLTLKQLETYGCALSTLATDTLVLKHQAISNHSVDKIFILLDKVHTKILHL